ncbi:hypothetical protein ACB094_11G127600 [Castanea mollissima]
MRNPHLSISEPHHRLTAPVIDKSWQLLPILFRIGVSARPEEEHSSKRVLLFDAPPDFVRYQCSIPGSPIHQSENGFVTVSMAAVSAAFREFAVFGGKVSRFGFRFLETDRVWDCNVKTYFRKRKRMELDGFVASMPKRRSSSLSENGENIMIRNMNSLKVILPPSKVELGVLNKETAISPVLQGSSSNFLRFPTTDLEHKEGKNDVGKELTICKEIPGSANTFKFCNGMFKTETGSNALKPMQVESITEYVHDLNLAPPSSFQDPLPCEEALISDIRFRFQLGYTTTIFQEEHRQCHVSPTVAGKYDIHSCDVSMSQPKEDAETQVKISRKEGCTNFSAKGDLQNLIPSEKTNVTHDALVNCLELRNVMDNITSDKDQTVKKVETQATFPIVECCSTQKVLAKSSCRLKGLRKNAVPQEPRVVMESLDHNKVVITPKQRDQCKSGQKVILMEKNLKQNRNKNVCDKENMVDTANSITSTLEEKTFPHFESFIIEEEEGSGGYGTVYRARRKNDGKMFAIKCPHANAPKHHVNNELKMLERFGGRNFIIKFEGSFQSGNSNCFVLEHVQHDRPEVLKKDIDVYQLQWYGYCLFRALACLHKQGVIHRDVKPGNFLLSRKLNKGYLIDFNLAMDLQSKYTIGSKSKSSHNVSIDHVPLPHSKSAPSIKDDKLVRGNFIAPKQGVSVNSRPTHEPNKNLMKRAIGGPLNNHCDLPVGNLFKSQGADGSGITSTKDATSTRIPSTERLREPLPFLGRKELISLVRDAVQSPGSQRERAAAPPDKIDSKIAYLSPMPLQSAGAQLLKSTGVPKQKREGPCVGTKGFRAPEVLLRSLYQGPKVDVWSAGVTLLYLMIGRTPFTGDPEQNIKDIVKLKGSEDLWEVAKLHDRDSSFPVDLFDIKFFPSMELQSWCKTHTKRPEFFKLIPRSLFDLVEKCLTVNPRLRLSADEALRHEFFASCHESLRKQRMLRQGLSLDSANVQSDHLLHRQSQVSLDL